MGQRSPSWTSCDSKGGRTFDRHNGVSAEGSESSHLGQLIRKRHGRAGGDPPRTFGSPRPYSEKTCQTRPIVLDRKDSWPIAVLCCLSRDGIASYLSRKRMWNVTMRG